MLKTISTIANQDYNKIAIRQDDKEVSYGEIWSQINYWITFFEKSLCDKNETIFIATKNSSQAITIFLACSNLGISVAFLTPILSSKTIEKLYEKLNPRLILYDVFFEENIKSSRINKKDLLNITNLSNENHQEELRLNLLKHEIEIILFSSATSNDAKPIITNSSHFRFYSGDYSNEREKYYVITLPHYVRPFLSTIIQSLQEGSICEIYTDISKISTIFHDSTKVDSLMTNAYGGKRITELLIKEDRLVTNITSFIVTGGIFHSVYQDRLRRIIPNVEIIELYGATEAGMISMIKDRNTTEKKYSVGVPSFFLDVKIDLLGAFNNEDYGEICVKSHYQMTGYLFNDERNQEYYKTGDLGYFKDGELYYLGRIEERIENNRKVVFVRDLEDFILRIEGVLDVAIINMEDRIFTSISVSKEFLIEKEMIKSILNDFFDLSKDISIEFVERINVNVMQKFDFRLYDKMLKN